MYRIGLVALLTIVRYCFQHSSNVFLASKIVIELGVFFLAKASL